MNQAEVHKLVSALRFKMGPKPLKLKDKEGYRGGLTNLRKTVTGLVVHERLEMKTNAGTLTRQYTERLISDAMIHGDKHIETMEMASWWLDSDKAAIHKLFKVLVPRYQNLDAGLSYTRLFIPPKRILTEFANFPHTAAKRLVVVELRGNPYPPLEYPNTRPNKRLIHNVLLAEAARDLKLSSIVEK